MDLVASVRDNIWQKYKDDIESEIKYDRRDVERIKSNDSYVHMYLQARENNIEDAVDMIMDTLAWRKLMAVNDIKETDFPKELFEVGAMYDHNHDLDGHRLLVLVIRLHNKTAVAEKIQHQFVLYWLEKMFWSKFGESHHRISVLFDMSGAGYSNMDLGLMKFIVNCFKFYYPSFLSYFIIYEMSFIFNAIWEIIKAWLPEKSRERVKFVKKSSIQQYIGVDQLSKHMGGTDEFKYVYSGECRQHISASDQFDAADRGLDEDELMKSARCESVNINSLDVDEIGEELVQNSLGEHGNKKVQFASDVKQDTPPGHNNVGSSKKNKPVLNGPLSIDPCDKLVFSLAAIRSHSHHGGGGDGGGREKRVTYTRLTLTNLTARPLAYKLKTTSPVKYKVRPVTGVLSERGGAAEQVDVMIILHEGYAVSLRDKFLVQCVPVPDTADIQTSFFTPSAAFTEVWRAAAAGDTEDKITTYRLYCSDGTEQEVSNTPRWDGDKQRNLLVTDKAATETDVTALLLNMQAAQTQISNRLERVERLQKFIITLLVFLSVLLILPYSGLILY